MVPHPRPALGPTPCPGPERSAELLLQQLEPVRGTPGPAGADVAPQQRQLLLGGADKLAPVRRQRSNGAPRDQGIGGTRQVVARTGPGVVGWLAHQAGPHRIPFDVAHDGQQVSVGLDREGVEALLEEVTPHPLAEVHGPRVATMGLPDAVGQRLRPGGHHDQMDVVRHEAPGPEVQPRVAPKLSEEVQVHLSVRVIIEERPGPDAALDDMVGEMGDHHPGQTSHGLLPRCSLTGGG